MNSGLSFLLESDSWLAASHSTWSLLFLRMFLQHNLILCPENLSHGSPNLCKCVFAATISLFLHNLLLFSCFNIWNYILCKYIPLDILILIVSFISWHNICWVTWQLLLEATSKIKHFKLEFWSSVYHVFKGYANGLFSRGKQNTDDFWHTQNQNYSKNHQQKMA